MQLCASHRVILQQIVSNAFSLDLYYLAFPNDRQFTKYLVYGIYIVEFVQTMLVAHDAFAMFGYGFGDMDALNRLNFSWLTVPVMGTVGAECLLPIVYYLSRVQFLVSGESSMRTASSYYQNHGSSRHSSFVSVSVLLLSSSLAHLFTGIIDRFCGRYDHRRLLFPSKRCHQTQQLEDVYCCRGV